MAAWQPSWISHQNDFAIFDLQVIQILPIKFRVYGPFYGPFCSGEVQNRFEDGAHGSCLECPIPILAFF